MDVIHPLYEADVAIRTRRSTLTESSLRSAARMQSRRLGCESLTITNW